MKNEEIMNKLKHQEQLCSIGYEGYPLSWILAEKEFLSICVDGNGFNNWNDDYYCMIEQQIGESLEV